MVARFLRVEQRLGERREHLGGAGAVAKLRGVVREAGEDAHDVAIHTGGLCAKRDARDGGGGVGADAGQLAPGVGRFWRRGHGDDRAGELVEIAGARVVAEALPEFQHLFLGGGGEGGEIGQLVEPAGKVGERRLDLRLLQHELADDGFVERGRFAPGQRAPVGPIPRQQAASECFGSGLQTVGVGGHVATKGDARQNRIFFVL
ncbi:MAG: hypothetical protein BWX86_00626 [Verrucomicrobia bacterium ADurb.Bin122]|nr:MAG: hypothetical protein BWX86_00626 [Verrucomicrobia bacterium ADurb.Bin122]